MRGERSPLIFSRIVNENENNMSDETQTGEDQAANASDNTNTEEQTNTENQENESQKTELEILKNRARAMGITFSNNIKVESLRKKIAAKQEGEADNTDDEGNEKPAVNETTTEVNPLAAAGTGSTEAVVDDEEKPMTKMQMRAKIRRDALKLVRIRLTCLDPKKRDLPGEYITVANRYIGTQTKFIPFGSEFYENGYHVPVCILKELESRRFLNITSRKGKQGTLAPKTNYIREFGIEILEPLTEEELAKLAAQQAASNSLADDD